MKHYQLPQTRCIELNPTNKLLASVGASGDNQEKARGPQRLIVH